jgi:hypothetical protein
VENNDNLELTRSETRFFLKMDRVIADAVQQMRGALQMILDERGIDKPMNISEDRTRLIDPASQSE